MAGAVVVLVLNYLVFEPFSQWRDQINTARAEVAEQQSRAVDLFDRQRRLRPVWADLTSGGLKSDPAEADSQARHAVLDWMQSAGVNLKAVNPERTTNANQFQIVG